MTGGEAFGRRAGGELAADVQACDDLLDRLGRREPCHADLDDLVAASLALLAGDVDLRPVPVEATWEALAAVGAWPPPDRGVGPVPARSLPDRPPVPTRGEGDGTDPAIILPRTSVEGIGQGSAGRPAAGHPDRRGGDRRRGDRRRGDRRRGDRQSGIRRDGLRRDEVLGRSPRVLRRGLPVGLVAAAALVVLGGVSAFVTTGDAVNPWGGLASVVSYWSGGHRPAVSRHDELAAKLEVARTLLSRGRPTEVTSILNDVRARLPELPPGERTDLESGIDALQGQLRATFTAGVEEMSSGTRDGRVPSGGGQDPSGLAPAADPQRDGDPDDGGWGDGGSDEPSRGVRQAPPPGLVQGTTASQSAPTSDSSALESSVLEPSLTASPPAAATSDVTTPAAATSDVTTPAAATSDAKTAKAATTQGATTIDVVTTSASASAERPLDAG